MARFPTYRVPPKTVEWVNAVENGVLQTPFKERFLRVCAALQSSEGLRPREERWLKRILTALRILELKESGLGARKIAKHRYRFRTAANVVNYGVLPWKNTAIKTLARLLFFLPEKERVRLVRRLPSDLGEEKFNRLLSFLSKERREKLGLLEN
ncbi:MAG: hypothetical protein QW343_01705 [Candidatus Norongarragalinales archaeon]